MQVLVSADWHIKVGAKNIPSAWAIDRYNQLFRKLHDLENTVDLHIIAGDIFDKVPSLEELELYYNFISGVKCKCFIIPGNHESLKKDTTFFSFLKSITTRVNPLVNVIDDFYTYGGIDFIPYNKLKEFEKGVKYTFDNNILVTHVRGEIPPHVKAEVDLSIFDKWKVVLAGDLHSYSNSQGNILYPGSPLTTSFHRSKVDTGVIIIDTDNLGEHRFISLDLPNLIRKTIKAGEPMVPTAPDLTIYEVSGDMQELASLSDNELLDKKVVKRNNDTSLILSPEMSLAQEVSEYLMYILELPKDTIDKVMLEYHNNIR